MGPLPAPTAATGLVSVALDADTSLAVPVHDGRAELARAVVLRGVAPELVDRFGTRLDPEAAERWLLERGARSPDEARADVRRFQAELERLERPTGPATGPRTAQGPLAGSPAPESWTRLARAVLEGERRLRFRASGRSMRPFVPHGSELEVAARPFAEVKHGEVVLHASARAPLVAHRVVGRRAGALLTCGDSNARVEPVEERDYLGVVVAVRQGDAWRPLTTAGARWLGLVSNRAYRVLVALTRLLFLRPLRATFGGPSLLRSALRLPLRAASGLLLVGERAAVRLRRPLDVLRAALLSSTEKDAERTRLYRRRAIQEFTAQEENVRAGLTLLEEVLLARHPLHGRVLVLGCGPGREALALARRGCRVTGLDREPGMLERARERARAEGLELDWRAGEAEHFELGGEPFDAIVSFSGLHNMLLPRARRVRLLAACRRHLRPGGRVLVTFLAAYRRPDADDAPRGKHLLEAMNPDHERGDLYLLNEAIHVFPRDEDVAEEAAEAGLTTVELFRDQRAYDRPAGQVRGYAVLARPE